MTARRVLLLGASGFLGRAVGRALDADDRVAVVVRLGSRPGADRPAEGWVRHDLLADPQERLLDLLRSTRPDVVVNCMGKLAGSDQLLTAANVLVTAKLVEAVPLAAPGARLVGIGSAAEYGVVPRGIPVDEDAATNPFASYGVTKLASTQLVRIAVRDGRLDGVVLRIFNPVGPGMPAENLLGRAAASIRAAMAEGRDRVVLGPLGACRDFVDIRDVAAAVRDAALVATVPEPVLNVGSGVATPVRAAVTRLADIAGFTGRIEESEPAPSRSAAVKWIAADTRRVRRCLGWSPDHDMDSSLEAVWAGEGVHARA